MSDENDNMVWSDSELRSMNILRHGKEAKAESHSFWQQTKYNLRFFTA